MATAAAAARDSAAVHAKKAAEDAKLRGRRRAAAARDSAVGRSPLGALWRVTRELGRGLVGAPWRAAVEEFNRCLRAILSCSPHAKPLECAPAPPRPVATLCCLFSFVVYYWDSRQGVWVTDKVLKMAPADRQYLENMAGAVDADAPTADQDEAPSDPASKEMGPSAEDKQTTRAVVPDVAHQRSGKVSKACMVQQMSCFSAGFKSPLMEKVTRALVPELNFEPAKLSRLTSISNPRVDTNAIVAVSRPLRLITVAFRGTSSKANMRTDVTFLKRGIDDSGGISGPRVHEGFHEAYFDAGIGPELEALIVELCAEHPGYDIMLTGHSLGGALATVLAYRLAYHANLPKDNPVFCITFGAPRVGDPSFAAALTEADVRVYRFVNNRDLVPRIPSVNYQHAGVLLWLRRKRKQAKNEEAPAATGAESASGNAGAAATQVGQVDVYGRGTEAPCNQQCLCCNLDVTDHNISISEVETEDGEVRLMTCVEAFDAPCGGWNPLRWGTGPRPSAAGARSDTQRMAVARAEAGVEFHGYMAAIRAVPDEDWPSSENWGGESCAAIKARAAEANKHDHDADDAPATEVAPQRDGGEEDA